MTTLKNKNYSGGVTPEIADIYERCNFSFPTPVLSNGLMVGHRLFPGDDTPRTFTNCNLVNCEPPPLSTLVGCNTSISEIDKVVSQDSVVIDGTEILTPVKENWYHGKYDVDIQGYFYHPEIIKRGD